MQRITLRLFAIFLMTLAAPVVVTRAAQTDDGMVSGGIGLTRAAWETEHGTGTQLPDAVPVYGELFAYEDDRYYVTFEGSKAPDDSVVMYLEVVWDDGVTWEEARDEVEALLPADAAIAAPFYAPPTPGGPTALNVFRYTSESLDAVPYGGIGTLQPDVLVIYHQQEEMTNTGHQQVFHSTVTRANLVAAIPSGD